MGNIFNTMTLIDGSAAETSKWHKLNRHAINPVRALTIDMNAADTITIEGTSKLVTGTDDPETLIEADDIVVLESYTGNTEVSKTLEGAWTFVRAVKTGTAGSAKVVING